MDKYHQKDMIKITEIELNVKNLDVMLDYYLHSLGFTLIHKDITKAILGTDNLQPIITLVENIKATKKQMTTGLYHFAILLPNRSDLGLFLRHVIKNQIPIIGAADHIVSEAIYLEDPENNGIELYIDKDESDWRDEFGTLKMGTQELDYAGVYYSADESKSFEKLPRDSIMGHVHLSVSSLQKARSFYMDTIGFNLAMDTVPKALFVGSANYHHHLGLNTWMGDKLPSPTSTGLKSFVITYPNCETIKKTIDQLQKEKYPLKEIEYGYQTKDFDGNTIYLKLQQ